LEALEDVVSRNEAFSTSVDSITEIELLGFVVNPELPLIKLILKLLKKKRQQLSVLVADVGKALADLSEMLRSEKLVSSKTELEVINQFLHAPALIELSMGVVSVRTTLEASCSHRGLQMAQSLCGSLTVEPAVCQVVIVLENVFQRSQGEEDGVLL